MLDVFNIAKPQGCDIQTFYGNAQATITRPNFSWQKPRGVSHVYMMLIGAGGSAQGGSGGGSGTVTVWYGSASTVPDILFCHASTPSGGTSRVFHKGSSGTFVVLLEAVGGSGLSGGAAMTANQFAASGFFQSIAGQNGGSGTTTPSTTTFLSGGADTTGIVQANYGYGGTVGNGYFQLQPIIVGVGGTNQQAPYVGGIGCGSGQAAAPGGPGMVLIASW